MILTPLELLPLEVATVKVYESWPYPTNTLVVLKVATVALHIKQAGLVQQAEEFLGVLQLLSHGQPVCAVACHWFSQILVFESILSTQTLLFPFPSRN